MAWGSVHWQYLEDMSKYQDGLDYYEATRDTASHFFIDCLPKGKYVVIVLAAYVN